MTTTSTLTGERAALRARAREFAGDVLAHVRGVVDPLPTATERYRATRPFYRQMVEAGFLRRLVPQGLGGDGTGASTTAVLAEELVAGDPSVALHLFATGLGLNPLLRAGSPTQHRRFLAPFLATNGTPIASLALSEPGGTANLDQPDPGTGLDVGLRTTDRPGTTTGSGRSGARSSGCRTRPAGTARDPTS